MVKRGRPTNRKLAEKASINLKATRWLISNWENFDDKTKLKIALDIHLKQMPTKVDQTTKFEMTNVRNTAILTALQNNRLEHTIDV
jgi:hypothetical protein